jgi:hypothetical protein
MKNHRKRQKFREILGVGAQDQLTTAYTKWQSKARNVTNNQELTLIFSY